MRALLAALALALPCVGCTIRPVPQDVAGYDTYQIVKKIRCETRDAIGVYVLGILEQTDPLVAEQVKNRSLSLASIKRSSLSSDAQKALDKYDQAAIVYEFTFDITEKNNITANADFIQTLNRGPFTLGISGSNQRQRQNTRNFRSNDSFEELVTGLSDKFCSGSDTGENWIYPITGTIGMKEMIGQFLNLNQSGNLIGTKDAPKVPALADTIVFTTTFTASANPKIVLTPLGRGFSFADAGITADATRSDVHKVIVAISLPPEAPVATVGGLSRLARARAQGSASANANAMVDYQNFLAVINAKPVIAVIP